MKNLKITLIALFVSSLAFSQASTDEVQWVEKQTKTVTMADGSSYETSHIIETERIKDVKLVKEDKNKLNQDIKIIPVRVTKHISLDYDKDPGVDRKVTVKYTEYEYMSLDFKLEPTGLSITTRDLKSVHNFYTKKRVENDFITANGTYNVKLRDGRKITVVVDEFETM